MKLYTSIRTTIAATAATGWALGNATLAAAQYSPARDWGFHPMMGFGGGWWGMIMGIVFWALVIIGLIFLVRWLVQNTGQRGPAGGGTRWIS